MNSYEQNEVLEKVLLAMYFRVASPLLEGMAERLEDAGKSAKEIAHRILGARADLRQPAHDGLSEEIRDSIIREKLEDDYHRLELRINRALTPKSKEADSIELIGLPLICRYVFCYYPHVEYKPAFEIEPHPKPPRPGSIAVIHFSSEEAQRMTYDDISKITRFLAEIALSISSGIGSSTALHVTAEVDDEVPEGAIKLLKENFLKALDRYLRPKEAPRIARAKLTTQAQDLFNLAKGFQEAAEMVRLACDQTKRSKRPQGGAPPDPVMETILNSMVERGLKTREIAKLLADRGLMPMHKNATSDNPDTPELLIGRVLDLRVRPGEPLSKINSNTYELYADIWEKRIKSALARRRKKPAPQRRRQRQNPSSS